MKITTIGVDLAKSVFQVHGVDERGKAVLRKQLRREQMAEFFAKLPACLVGMEACGSAHHWARVLQGHGHTVRLIAAQFVKPYVKSNKNDAADAAAICEAVSRPHMRFVPIKSVEQQAVLAVHRARQGFVKARAQRRPTRSAGCWPSLAWSSRAACGSSASVSQRCSTKRATRCRWHFGTSSRGCSSSSRSLTGK